MMGNARKGIVYRRRNRSGGERGTQTQSFKPQPFVE